MKKPVFATIFVFFACAVGVALFATRERLEPEPPPERHRMRVVIPAEPGEPGQAAAMQGQAAYESAYILKAPMEPGELVISVLNFDFGNSGAEDQVVAFRGNGGAGPVYIAFFSFDGPAGGHARMWDLPTSAAVPGTVSLFTLDILGDRGNVIVVTGMNEESEHTMTVFRRSPFNDPLRPFDVIAAIQTDGSVAIHETPRSLAYQQGIARGQPFNIVASGSDPSSANILDRLEVTYSFSAEMGAFLPSGSVRIPGARVEQDRVRHILSGAPGAFEDFLSDLWYHVTPAGTIDRDQFLFFDPARQEIIFFGEESQQRFVWQRSNPTRQGIFIASYNRTITAMRRLVNVELESMDSIRVTVTDDRRQRIGVPPPWSGTYRRAGAAMRAMEASRAMPPHKDAVFDSPIGRLRFLPSGEYELSAHGAFSRGRYIFFSAGGMDLLELRPDLGYVAALGAVAAAGTGSDGRQVFHVTGIRRNAWGEPDAYPQYMNLSRVRLGATGIHQLYEAQIALTRASY